jgi:HPt (histidine-containing phosphotransfer) domain-containing protein
VEATLAIREKEKGGKAHLFIIGLTGNATAEDERRMLEAGMDAFLTKPIHMQKLYQTVALAGYKWESASDSATSAAPPDAPMAVNVVTPASLAETATPSDDESPGVREQLDRMTGGNDKLARSLVKTFLADAPKALQQIQAAYKQKKPDKLATAAHLLKGSLSIFGAPKAVAAARNLQNLGRSGKLAKAGEELRDLQKAYAELVHELHSLYPASSAPESGPSRGTPKAKSSGPKKRAERKRKNRR